MAANGKDRRRKLPAAEAAVERPAGDWNEEQHGPRGMLLTRSCFVGPMPPPDVVAQYEEILPGAAKFFFGAFERQSAHRQALEQIVVSANVHNERVGMWLAFTVAIIVIFCGTFLIFEDKDPQGLAMIGATVATLCGVFIYSRRQERTELREKDPALAVE